MLRSPMIVSGPHGVEFHAGHFNLPPILLVLLCGALLIRGTRESATTNAIMVVIKLAILIFFVVIAFTGFDINNFHPFFNGPTSHGPGGMVGVTAAAATVFLFLHWPGHRGDRRRGSARPDPQRPEGILAALVIVSCSTCWWRWRRSARSRRKMFEGQEAGLAVILQTSRQDLACIGTVGRRSDFPVFSVTLVTILRPDPHPVCNQRDGLIPKAFQKVNPAHPGAGHNTVIVCIAVGIVAGLVDSTSCGTCQHGDLTAFMVVSIAVRCCQEGRRVCGKVSGVPFGPYLVPA